MTVWARRNDWVGSQVDDQYVMIHLDSGRYMALNQTASEAWAALETPRTRDDIVAVLTNRFKVEEQDCRRSVDAMLEKMSRLELIESVGSTTV